MFGWLEALANVLDKVANAWVRRRELQDVASRLSEELEKVRQSLVLQTRSPILVAGYMLTPRLDPMADDLIRQLSWRDPRLYELLRDLRIRLENVEKVSLDLLKTRGERDAMLREQETMWARLGERAEALARGDTLPPAPSYDFRRLNELERSVEALADLRGVDHGKALEGIDTIQRRLGELFRIGEPLARVVKVRDDDA